MNRNRLYIRPKTPSKRRTQLADAIAAATSPAARFASRAPRSAISGTLATAKTIETARRAPRPPLRWATIQAKTKWSGAPPRSAITVCRSSPNDSRPTKSASVSSSCGGQRLLSQTRVSVSATEMRATPAQTSRPSSTRARARSNRTVRGRRARSRALSFAPVQADHGASFSGSRAHVRIQVSERARLRSLQAHRRSSPGGVRCVRRFAGRDGSVPRAGALSRIGVLLDRLRPRRTKEGACKGVGRLRRWGEEGPPPEKKAAEAS